MKVVAGRGGQADTGFEVFFRERRFGHFGALLGAELVHVVVEAGDGDVAVLVVIWQRALMGFITAPP